MKYINLKSKGFTLVELVIVIAIVIVLSVVSVPIYRSYVDKAKMAEGYALLGTILSAQKAYYSEYGNFLRGNESSAGFAWTCNENVLGIDGRGNKFFTRFVVGSSGGGEEPKYYFDAAAIKPADLQGPNNTSLLLQYNITLGGKVVDNPVNYDSSWRKK